MERLCGMRGSSVALRRDHTFPKRNTICTPEPIHGWTAKSCQKCRVNAAFCAVVLSRMATRQGPAEPSRHGLCLVPASTKPSTITSYFGKRLMDRHHESSSRSNSSVALHPADFIRLLRTHYPLVGDAGRRLCGLGRCLQPGCAATVECDTGSYRSARSRERIGRAVGQVCRSV